MSRKRTYLELSEDDGVSHKFYEVTVDGTDVTIRYGRIGTDGQSSTKSHPTEAKAEADAAKKLKAKRKKGYEDAVMGVRQKRAITRRTITSKASTAKPAPVLWKFQTGSDAFGIFVDDKACWVGNQQGRVFSLNHENGQVQKEFKLPEGVKCLVADEAWLYAGCDDGNVYDLTDRVPHVAYAIDDAVNIYWLDICDGVLAVSDDQGGVHVWNHEGEEQWKTKSTGTSGWMVRCDQDGVYHGHSKGVTLYNLKDGSTKWHKETGGDVLFGWQEQTLVFAGTAGKTVSVVSKDTGEIKVVCQCDDSVYSCAAAENGKYIFAGDSSSSVYCFDSEGKRLWKLGTGGCGSAFSMQFHNDRVYIVTTDGYMACIDASEQAIANAEKGTIPKSRDFKAPTATTGAATTDTQVESTSDESNGVVVVCVKQGSKLRVRPRDATSSSSSGKEYHTDWNVQFPKNLRQEGSRFVVDELREAKNGKFYRAHGNIRRLV